MNKLVAIGEALIDFTAQEKGDLLSVNGFEKNAGGAPANVAVCVARLGGRAAFVSKLGQDAFGNYLLKVLSENNVDVTNVLRTDQANTALAFVALDEKGERNFSFYRNPSADMLLGEDEISSCLMWEGDILHFCSVDLIDAPVRAAHRRAIEYAEAAGSLISFDPNLRQNLWRSEEKMLSAVREFLPRCNLLKVSEEELLAIAGKETESAALQQMFQGNVTMVLVSRGGHGASVFLRSGEQFSVPGEMVTQVDSTGAGDVFIGTFLYQILENGITVNSLNSSAELLQQFLFYANHAAALSVTKRGAIPSMPFYEDVFNISINKNDKSNSQVRR